MTYTTIGSHMKTVDSRLCQKILIPFSELFFFRPNLAFSLTQKVFANAMCKIAAVKYIKKIFLARTSTYLQFTKVKCD